MQATPGGDFYPENDLDKRYKIPKRQASQMSGPKQNYNNARHNAQQTPLANSYYNYPYDPNAASAYYQNYSQYYQQYGQAHNNANTRPNYNNQGHNSNNQNANSNSQSTGYSNYNNYNNTNYNNAPGGSGSGRIYGNVPPPPPPPPGTEVEPIKQKIYNTLRNIKEEPKSYNNRNLLEHTIPDLADATLPKELKIMFQPLYCKLCTAQLSSNQTAKLHYRSKNHEKNIKKWLTAYSEKTGEPLPKRAKVSLEKKSEDADKNPAWFHCDVCDLDLTGKLHAESHYMGRAHQKAILGHKAPAGRGYYDDNGKWVRTKAPKSTSFNFENGEDNFGMAFKLKQESTEGSDTDGPSPSKKKKESPPGNFHCDVCNVNTTCQEQLDSHFRGQKHMKKLKNLGLNNYTEQRELIDQAGYVPSTPSIADSAHSLNDKELNLSVYRTPSGDYYCPSCNLTLNSEIQFLQHMKSKNHAKKAAQKKSSGNN